jgi:hypothetical protein
MPKKWKFLGILNQFDLVPGIVGKRTTKRDHKTGLGLFFWVNYSISLT